MFRVTYPEIAALISSVGLPYTYHHWEVGKVPPLPYIVFLYDQQRGFTADNSMYQKIVSVTLELYSNKKDFNAEERVEQTLEENGIIYEKYEEYISSEKMFEQVYEFEVLLEVEHE